MIEKSLKSETTNASAASTAKAFKTGPSSQKDDSQTRSNERAQKLQGAASSAQLYEVEIAGVPLRLKSSHDEKTVTELIAFVDRKVREALTLTKTGSIQNAAILASLHLAEEYLLLKRTAKVELDSLEAKTQKVISELESSRVNTGLSNN